MNIQVIHLTFKKLTHICSDEKTSSSNSAQMSGHLRLAACMLLLPRASSSFYVASVLLTRVWPACYARSRAIAPQASSPPALLSCHEREGHSYYVPMPHAYACCSVLRLACHAREQHIVVALVLSLLCKLKTKKNDAHLPLLVSHGSIVHPLFVHMP